MEDIEKFVDVLVEMSEEEKSMVLAFMSDLLNNRGKDYTYYFTKSY